MKYIASLVCILIHLCISSQIYALDLDQCESKELVITAYYSPEKNQAFYIHGDYQTEIKVNGQGTHGASGKPVYDGMIAGPSIHEFGTVVVIPKIGNGVIHDRGGAIISDPLGSGSNSEAIDIRVGKGTAGLMRALTFGRQTRKGYICPSQTHTDIGFAIDKMPSYKHFFDVTLRAQRMSQGRKDQRVEALQKYLWKMGYLRQEDVHGNYNQQTVNAVCKFQVKTHILAQEDPICGTFGPKTSFTLKKEAQARGLLPDDLYTLTTLAPVITRLSDTSSGSVLQNHKQHEKPKTMTGTTITDLKNLKGVKHRFYRYYKPGEVNTEIIFLQQFLQQNGYYLGKINGINSPSTKDALYQFQLAFALLTTQSPKELHGFLGPQTRTFINQTQVK